jgi:hypothetical protein
MDLTTFSILESGDRQATVVGSGLDQLATIARKALLGAARSFDPDCGLDFVDHASRVIPRRIRVFDVFAGNGRPRS